METGLTSSIPCLGERLEFTQLGVNSEQRGQSEPQTGPPKDDMFPGIRLDRKKKKIRRTSKPSVPATAAEMGTHEQI